jgi:hypothetical protein
MQNDADIVARRRLSRSGNPIEVILYRPRRDPDGSYICQFSIIPSPGDDVSLARGIDEFQSMFIALELVRKRLKQFSEELEWDYGIEGDLGFPMIPLGAYVFGKELRTRIEKLIEFEIEKHSNSIGDRSGTKE